MGALTNQYVSQSYLGLIKFEDSFTGVTNTLQTLEDGIGNNLPIQISSTEIQLYGLQDTSVTGSFNASGLNYPTADNGIGSFIQTDGAGNLSLQYVKTVYEEVKNRENITIPKGSALFVSGNTGNRVDVYLADSSNPNRRPATLIAADNIQANQNGLGIITGLINGVNVGSLAAGTEVYLGTNGGWTATRPTGSAQVQILGIVSRTGNNGAGYVINQLQAELPNLQSGYTWVGDASGVPQQVVYGGGGGSINTGSFITTGSIGGNQGITGSLEIENDLRVVDSLLVDRITTDSNTTLEIEPVSSGDLLLGVANGSTTVRGEFIIDGTNVVFDTGTVTGFTYGWDIDNGGQDFILRNANVNITGSVKVYGNNLSLLGTGQTTPDLVTSSIPGTSNLIWGLPENRGGFPISSYTGSLILSGSNNIVPGVNLNPVSSIGGIIAGSYDWYISGSYNNVGRGIALERNSIIKPNTNYNMGGGGIASLFTSSSFGQPQINTNILSTAFINLDHRSGSINFNNNVINNTFTSVQNLTPAKNISNVTLNMGGAMILTHSSSSISYNRNLSNGLNNRVNNSYSSSFAGNSNGIAVDRNIIYGQGNLFSISGSNSTNAIRSFTDNIIGGSSNIVNSDLVNDNNSNLFSTIVWGQNLIISSSHVIGVGGGTAVFGRFNQIDSNVTSNNTIFSVGTGTNNSNRKTGFLINSNSDSKFNGNVIITGSLTVETGSAYFNTNNGQVEINDGKLLFTRTDSSDYQIRVEAPDVKGVAVRNGNVALGVANNIDFFGNPYNTNNFFLGNNSAPLFVSGFQNTIIANGSSAFISGASNLFMADNLNDLQYGVGNLILGGYYEGNNTEDYFMSLGTVLQPFITAGGTNYPNQISFKNDTLITGSLLVRDEIQTSGSFANIYIDGNNDFTITNTEVSVGRPSITLNGPNSNQLVMYVDDDYIGFKDSTGNYFLYRSGSNDSLQISNDTFVTGALNVSGSATITGSVQGNVNALSISSNTASLNLNDGNFFTLQLVEGTDTRIEPSNIKAGQTVNIKLNTTGSATVSFPSSVKQISGSAYVPTTTTGTDIITMVSFDVSDLYLANVKNLI